ncbi:RHS repeat-associated protein [Stenotrophomonas sp. 2619]
MRARTRSRPRRTAGCGKCGPVAVTDTSGVVIERTVYGAYGEVINRPLAGGPGYTGHVEDAETGLNYMQQRYYEAEVGRFLSVDPVTAYNNPIGQFNRYRYADSNPYRFVDPDGRMSSMMDHPGIAQSSVQGLNREAGSEAAKMPVAMSKSVAAVPGEKGVVDPAEADAVGKINASLDNAMKRVDHTKNPAVINAWNEASWKWDPGNLIFVREPNTAAFVNPVMPTEVVLGARLAAFASYGVKFNYHNISFFSDRAALNFVIMHEFGHVWTAGRGVPGSDREIMANNFSIEMLSASDRRMLKCAKCR